jgi:hypothetical protein
MTAIESRTAARVNLSVLQLAALTVASLSVVGYVVGALLALVSNSIVAWWHPDVLLAVAVASVGVFLLSAALRGVERSGDARPGSRLWASDRWPAWLGAVIGIGGVVLYAVLADRWAEQFMLADAGNPLAATSLGENVALYLLCPFLVLSPLLAAGVVWWVGRQRR